MKEYRIASGDEFLNDHLTDGLVFKRMSDVVPEPIHWLWRNRLARGKVTLMAGDPGLGKSQITLNAGAHVSTGTPWPDGDLCEQGSIVILSAEDAANDTVRPRLEAADADLDRVHILEAAIEKG